MPKEIIDLIEKPEACPKCGQALAEIQYGTPVMNAQLIQGLAAGTVKLGGCCTTGNDPQYYCKDCGKYYRVSSKRSSDAP